MEKKSPILFTLRSITFSWNCLLRHMFCSVSEVFTSCLKILTCLCYLCNSSSSNQSRRIKMDYFCGNLEWNGNEGKSVSPSGYKTAADARANIYSREIQNYIFRCFQICFEICFSFITQSSAPSQQKPHYQKANNQLGFSEVGSCKVGSGPPDGSRSVFSLENQGDVMGSCDLCNQTQQPTGALLSSDS